MLRVRGVSKVYKGHAKVLSDINMYVGKGEIVGIVGLNGAGKSTLMRAISGATDIYGSIMFQGRDIKYIGENMRKKISFLNTSYNIYQELTVRQNLELFRKLYHATEEQMNSIIERMGISTYLDKKASELSTGMRKRAEIACSTMHEFNLLLLDEPTNGLDIEAKEEVLDYFEKLRNENTSILITSHNINDIEKLCDRIYILKEGKIIKESTVNNLMNEASANTNKWIISLHIRPELEEVVKDLGYEYRFKDNIMEVIVSEEEKQNAIVNLANYQIISINSEITNLEDAILNIVHGGEDDERIAI